MIEMPTMLDERGREGDDRYLTHSIDEQEADCSDDRSSCASVVERRYLNNNNNDEYRDIFDSRDHDSGVFEWNGWLEEAQAHGRGRSTEQETSASARVQPEPRGPALCTTTHDDDETSRATHTLLEMLTDRYVGTRVFVFVCLV